MRRTVCVMVALLLTTPAFGATLTANKVTKAKSASVIVDSIIIDNGTNVGVGSSVPTAKLDVIGGIAGTGLYSSGNVGIGTVVGSSLLSVGATSQMTISSAGNVSTSGTLAAGATTVTGTLKASGNVGIGTTSVAAKLQFDPSIYSATNGSGGNRTLCISADGKVFSSATACP